MRKQLLVLSILSATSGFGETPTPQNRGPQTGWSPFFQGGSVYHSQTDLDDGGSFSVTRNSMEGGMAYVFRKDRMVSLSLGYGQDDYRFSSTAIKPWDHIDHYRANLFARWRMTPNWMGIATTSLRTSGETGVDLNNALTAGGFAGASYTLSDKLSVGPGLGVFGRIEDHPLFIPIIIINWNITDKLSLGTGGGQGATTGPGLTLDYKASRHWNFSLAGLYDQKRFRLDERGLAPNGVGEDRSIPVLGSMRYVLYPGTHITGVLGYNFGGKLRLEDAAGGDVYAQSYDSSFFAGITIRMRF